MRRIIAGCGLAAGLSAALAGCQTPEHSNVLIFGTDTKLALDVGFNATTSTPSVTIGYKRQEGVWMPLVPNVANPSQYTYDDEGNVTASSRAAAGFWDDGDNYVPVLCDAATMANCSFRSTHYRTNTGADAYSVLASFGAELRGGASGDGVVSGSADPTPGGNGTPRATARAQGSVGIAQYFATGLAAQILADRGGASLVSVQPANEVAELLQASEEARSIGARRTAGADMVLRRVSSNGQFNQTCWNTLIDANAAAITYSTPAIMKTATDSDSAMGMLASLPESEVTALSTAAANLTCPVQ